MTHLTLFQFQTGAIKSTVNGNLAFALMLFQFQTGAIKSDPEGPDDDLGSVFQFQTGAIKSAMRLRPNLNGDSFNSKLVRLKG